MAAWAYPAATGTTSRGWRAAVSNGPAGRSSTVARSVSPPAITKPRWTALATPTRSPAPTACDTTGSSAKSTPMPNTATPKKYRLPIATAARSVAETRPTMIVSTAPMAIIPTWMTATGNARRTSSPRSPRLGLKVGDAGRTGRHLGRTHVRRIVEHGAGWKSLEFADGRNVDAGWTP
jgi:hypothetical protein